MNQTGVSGNKKIKALMTALGLAVALTALLMLVAAGIMLSAGISGTGISIIVLLINILPVFLSGFFLGKKVEEKKYIWGVVLAVVFFLIYLGIALAFQSGNTVTFGNCIRTFIILSASGMLGGMLS